LKSLVLTLTVRIDTKRLDLALLVGSLAIGAGLRFWLCFHDDGLFWPDEIYQSLEPAHRLVYGYGLVAWEFIEGARNWALPALVAALLGLARGLGADQPAGYLPFVRVCFALIGVGTAYGSYRLARVCGAGERPAAVAAALFALGAPFIYFAPRAMSETASALPVVFGLALALGRDATRWKRLLGASLLGLAVLLRLQNGIFCVGLLGVLAGRKQWRAGGEALAVLALWAFAFGLLDRLTWGGWFHSAVVYLRFNFGGGAERWGTAEPTFYLRVLVSSLGPLGLVLLGFSACAWPKARGLLLTAAGFLALHSATGHKEYRFMLPALPVFCALAGVGLTLLSERAPKNFADLALYATLLAAVISGIRFHQLTFGELGQYEDSKPNASAYDDSGPVNRLLLAANRLPDVCGLKIESVHQAWTGGYSYFHRNVPLYPHTGPGRGSGYFNYVITAANAGPLEPVAADGPLVLARVGQGCAADPGYSWRLP
jgi:phosphatidylinositol glycan class B